ncbi:thiamine transporter 2-like [Culicoides brevitarsis]|uniref:thiamine transporter 2-like n=1 Tax=Culicoides brevitarsis TaxID=469753 RepID=UPI00307C2DC4
MDKNVIKVSILLCAFGFFRELRPSEPYVAQFYANESYRNATIEKVNREIYPAGTFSYLAQLFIIFLITDILRYKPIIILSSICGIIMWSLMLWTDEYYWLLVIQIFYGTYMAAEVAYYTYMYAKCDRKDYQKVTSHTRAAITAGKFLSGLIAQLLYSFEVMDIRELNYISFATQLISLPLAFLLPSVSTSVYFYKNTESIDNTKCKNDANLQQMDINQRKQFSSRDAILLIKTHFLQSYSNKEVLYWSIWWFLATGGFIQAQTYAQILWDDIDQKKEIFYNGAVEAAYTLAATLAALAAGFINLDFFHSHHLWIITGSSIVEGLLIICEGLSSTITIAYAIYILFGTMYQFMITLLSACVANQLADDSFALIFGINTFLALVFQSVFTVIFVNILQLSPKYQYVVNGSYFLVLAFIYLVLSLIDIFVSRRRRV